MKIILALLLFAVTISYPQEGSTNSSILYLQEAVKNTDYSDADKLEFPFNTTPKKKSTGLAILYSLLLPGMGELYAESYQSGKYFTIAEGILWGTYIGMNTYANWQKDRYKSFAESYAGVNPAGKDDDYYAIISEYLNITEYNDDRAKQRRFNEMFDTEAQFWKWQNQEDRRTYRSMWVSSEQTFNDIRFVVGILLVNRLVSAINAVRLVSAYNKQQAEQLGWNVSLGVIKNPDYSSGLSLNFHTNF